MIATCEETSGNVRNRHEAYGIAAQQLSEINATVKDIKDATATLLLTLSDPNLPAIDATSKILTNTITAANRILMAAAMMHRTLDNLYRAENLSTYQNYPMDEIYEDAEEMEE
jgi:hypothetical protein